MSKKAMCAIHHKVGCLFTVEKYKADGTITQRIGPFHNTVLDDGLDGLADYSLSDMTARCHVGTGNTAPTTSDTALDSSLATTTSLYGSQTSSGTQTGSTYAYTRRTFNFSIGSVTGNLAEVGLSRDDGPSYTFFNRQLFLDETDSPTTVTVLADEGLRVTAEARLYADIDSSSTSTGSFTFDNDGSNETINWTRHCKGSSWTHTATSSYNAAHVVISKPSDVAIDSSTNETASTGTDKSSVSYGAYTGGTYTRTNEYTWNAGAYSGDIANISTFCAAVNRETFLLDPAITVASTEKVIFSLSFSWGRYTA